MFGGEFCWGQRKCAQGSYRCFRFRDKNGQAWPYATAGRSVYCKKHYRGGSLRRKPPHVKVHARDCTF